MLRNAVVGLGSEKFSRPAGTLQLFVRASSSLHHSRADKSTGRSWVVSLNEKLHWAVYETVILLIIRQNAACTHLHVHNGAGRGRLSVADWRRMWGVAEGVADAVADGRRRGNNVVGGSVYGDVGKMMG